MLYWPTLLAMACPVAAFTAPYLVSVEEPHKFAVSGRVWSGLAQFKQSRCDGVRTDLEVADVHEVGVHTYSLFFHACVCV